VDRLPIADEGLDGWLHLYTIVTIKLCVCVCVCVMGVAIGGFCVNPYGVLSGVAAQGVSRCLPHTQIFRAHVCVCVCA
jgi:hypothetical protein